MVRVNRSRHRTEYDANGKLIGSEVFWRVSYGQDTLPMEISTLHPGIHDVTKIGPPTGKALAMELLMEFQQYLWGEKVLAYAMSQVFPGSTPKTSGGMKSYKVSKHGNVALVKSDWRYVFMLSSVVLEWSFEAVVDEKITGKENIELHLWNTAMQYMILEVVDLLDTQEKLDLFIDALCRKVIEILKESEDARN